MELTQEEMTWLKTNLKFISGAMSTSTETREKIYQIYNKISDVPKQPTSCGRCFRNVKREILKWYQKNQ